jgi:hypothetical protein
MFKKIALSIVLVVSALFIYAQTGSVRGFVYDKKTGEPIMFTSVQLLNTSFGANTDANGYYSITKVPPGEYTIVVNNFQFAPYSESITIVANRTIDKKINLLDGGEILSEVDISAERKEAKTEVKISEITVTKKDIKSVPAIGGESDIATYFQTVPGVVTTGDQGGQLYVRGGSPIQNKVLLDGMTIYNPFHSIGFFSVFDTEIIRSADIYTGGFSAEYGGRISSVMDITTKDGNKTGQSGRLSLTPFGAKGLLEGPIKKAKNDNDGTISYIFSAKTSYLEQSSKIFYPYVDTAGLPFNFTDFYGKISFAGATGSKFNVFGFNFNDRVRYQGISNLAWNSFGAGSNFVLLPYGSNALITGKLSYSKYEIALQEEDLPERRSSIDGFDLGFDFKYFIKQDEIKYGIELLGFTTDFVFNNAANRVIQQKQNTTEFSAYVDYKMVRGLFVIQPSFRLQYYASLGNTSPEPRLGVKYNAADNLRFKFAGGFYSQNFIAANSDRDVVNLFYGFLSGPSNLQQKIISEDGTVRNRTHSLQKSQHAIFGFELDLTNKLLLNVEGYYKNFSQLTNVNRFKIFEESDASAPDLLKRDYIIETGAAKGIDFLLKYTTKKMYVWAVYSLGKVDRWDGFQTYSPVFDRRHNVNLVFTYAFKNNWEVNARWNFGSGLPFTPRSGYYHNIDFSNGLSTDLTTVNSDDLQTILGSLNSSRLPTYHRLDITVKKDVIFKNKTKLEINVGATNLYNRENIFYVIPERNQSIYQLPLLPSIGIAWNF